MYCQTFAVETPASMKIALILFATAMTVLMLHASPIDVDSLDTQEDLNVRVERQYQFIYENHRPVGCVPGYTWHINARFFCCFGAVRRCCSNANSNDCWL